MKLETDSSFAVAARRDRRKLTRSPVIRSLRCTDTEPVVVGAYREEESGTGTVRLKLVVSKEQLRQAAEAAARGGSEAGDRVSPALEQLLHILRRRHVKKVHMSKWKPQLHSIPEEF